MDEATWLGAGSLLQSAGGGYFTCSGPHYWATRVAVPTRRTEAEGHSIAASGSGVCFDGDDLAGVVGAFPRTTKDSLLAGLLFGARSFGGWHCGSDWALGRLSQRRKPARLNGNLSQFISAQLSNPLCFCLASKPLSL